MGFSMLERFNFDRVGWMLNPNDALLVLIDVQGKLAHLMHDKDTLFKNLQKCIRGAQVLDIPILWVEQNPERMGATIPEIASLLDAYEPFAKMSFSCFRNGEINQELIASKRNQILVAGIEAHVCVYQAVLDLVAMDYQVEVIADAVSSRTPENKNLSLQKIQNAGAFLTTTEMSLFELLGTAEEPRFKEILEILKPI